MSKFDDKTGRRYGRLTVIERVFIEKGRTNWLCKCDCGNTCIVRAGNLAAGSTKSCGCMQKERARAFAEKTFAQAQKRKAAKQ